MERKIAAIFIGSALALSMMSGAAMAYWVWTLETKKFINPKYAVKDTPREQYNWAMSFYGVKDYKRASVEFEKLVKNYEYSEYAANAQYHAGLSYDNMGKYYIAFQNYQKTIDNFPHVSNIDEIIARQFNIANMYAAKSNPKVLGTDIMTSYDRAIEIYKKVVDNAPFGKLADEAQFRMALTMKDAGLYDEATVAFQKIMDDYSSSRFYEQARYEMANSAYKASLKPAYDAAPTDKALKAFEEFTSATIDKRLNEEAQKTIKRLKNKVAEKSFMTAEFYERQKHYASAIIYYQDVINKYPDSSFAEISKVRIADLKIGNYAHKSQAQFEVDKEKKGWMPWVGKEKAAVKAGEEKPSRKKVKKPWTPFRFGKETAKTTEIIPEAAKSIEDIAKPAETAKEGVEPVAEIAKESVEPAETAKESIEPTEAGKEGAESTEQVNMGAKKRWWAYGLDIKDDHDAEKTGGAKVKKGWTPLNFDTSTAVSSRGS
jgi:outer membrane assembly lipoprotein YfiO